MSNRRFTHRTVVVSAAFILAMGASGVAVSSAFAAGAPTSVESSGAEFTLVDNGAGSFSLSLTVPGTSIAIDYTVDATGAILGAASSTNGATVTVDGHELVVTLADGRVVEVEIGDDGDAVEEVSVESEEGDDSDDSSDDSTDDSDDSTDDSDDSDDSSDDSPDDSDDSSDDSTDDSDDSSDDSTDDSDDGDVADDGTDDGTDDGADDSSDSGSDD